MILLKKTIREQGGDRSCNKFKGSELYLFVPEDGVFKTYITDRTGSLWRAVTRWTVSGLERFGEEGIKAIEIRPFSISAVDGGKTAGLRYILTNILYDRKPLDKGGVFRALCEPFDSGSGGILDVFSQDIPFESILRSAFVLNDDPNRRALSLLCKKDIEAIISAIYEK